MVTANIYQLCLSLISVLQVTRVNKTYLNFHQDLMVRPLTSIDNYSASFHNLPWQDGN